MTDSTSRATRLWGLGLAAFLAAALVAACGGGGSSTGDAGATAQTYTNGPIAGFGSVIVNSVRFDDSSARVEDDDGNASSSSGLKLGMMCEIDSGDIDDSAGRAVARLIRFGSEIVGPVASVDTAAGSFTVLNQTVDVKPETVFDGTLTLATLAGKTVEVHALFDATSGHYVATRVEAEDNVVAYKLRGLVSQLDKTAKTFHIGAALISYTNVADADLPANFADGQRVRVRLQMAQVAGAWVAVTIKSGVHKVEDHDRARLIGTVTKFGSATSFEVNGLAVDATNAAVDGTVALGARVVLRGTVTNGVIVASQVTVLKPNDDKIRGVELHGTITGTPDASAQTFVLRGVTVAWDANTVFQNGSATQLVANARLEVKGVLSTDQKTLSAKVIEFE